MKPDDIPAEVWDYAEKAVFSRFSSASERIARAMMQARSQAFEEASKIADAYSRGGSGFQVAKAIRQHSQKGRDK